MPEIMFRSLRTITYSEKEVILSKFFLEIQTHPGSLTQEDLSPNKKQKQSLLTWYQHTVPKTMTRKVIQNLSCTYSPTQICLLTEKRKSNQAHKETCNEFPGHLGEYPAEYVYTDGSETRSAHGLHSCVPKQYNRRRLPSTASISKVKLYTMGSLGNFLLTRWQWRGCT